MNSSHYKLCDQQTQLQSPSASCLLLTSTLQVSLMDTGRIDGIFWHLVPSGAGNEGGFLYMEEALRGRKAPPLGFQASRPRMTLLERTQGFQVRLSTAGLCLITSSFPENYLALQGLSTMLTSL